MQASYVLGSSFQSHIAANTSIRSKLNKAEPFTGHF